MQVLSDYLAKYKNLAPPEASAKRLLIDTVRSECGIALKDSEVSIRNNVAFITCHPAVRSELRLCSGRVLTVLQKQGVRLSKLT
jgi:hypothetical protein